MKRDVKEGQVRAVQGRAGTYLMLNVIDPHAKQDRRWRVAVLERDAAILSNEFVQENEGSTMDIFEWWLRDHTDVVA